MGAHRSKGVSRTVRVTTLVFSAHSSAVGRHIKEVHGTVYGATAIAKEKKRAEEMLLQNIAGLSAEKIWALSDMRGDSVVDDSTDNNQQDLPRTEEVGAADDMEWEMLSDDLQNDSTFTTAFRDIAGSKWKPRWYKDMRTWRQRMHHLDENWQPLLPKLVDVYLSWRYGPDRPADEPTEATASADDGIDYNFKTPVLDIYSTVNSVLYKPSFSVEAFAKLLCHFYMIPFRRRYRATLGDAFDIYLTILRMVRKKVLSALGCDMPNWRALNGCPACRYELKDEPSLEFSCMYCMDGNSSLKRLAPVGGRRAGDLRTLADSDYYLPEDFIEKYADEVQSRRTLNKVDVPLHRDTNEDAESDRGEDQTPDGGDPTDGDMGPVSGCTENWKAAAAEEKKKMWGVFEETGIFASACRHGLILWLIDMVRSSELAKYPLAIIAKAMEVFGPHTLAGYDIGCSFEQTVHHSSLGPTFTHLHSRCCVNAFHSYSHFYPCQIRYHPNVIKGMGLEDLETLECIFSASNLLASWDNEKYSNLGTMLYNNYKQVLDIIQTPSVALADAMASLGVCDEDLKLFELEEQQYFATLGQEPEWDVYAMAYVEALQELRAIITQVDEASSWFLNATPTDYQFLPPTNGPTWYEMEMSTTRKLETRRLKMGITNRLQPSDAPYVETVKYIATHKYQLALGKLQRLVIQRLFELHKLNLTQTAYRVCTHISKSLQTRCRAIRNAVTSYNIAAAALNPPRPTLDWDKVSHYSFLEEFNLLHDTHHDIREKQWTQPAMQETMRLHCRIQRAHEKIQRCNIEVRHIYTHIRDEDMLFSTILDDLCHQQDPLHGAVLEYCSRRRVVNTHILAFLQRIYALPGFTGNPFPGERLGVPHSLPVAHSDVEDLLSAEMHELNEEERAGLELDDDDEAEGDISGLVDYVSNLAV
ncbi:hypothetical protein SCP_1101010 [Sparassis crispa]|uniref:CxC2-like cysteine cluster KDZ transposase-associated domain-containing protein n=1 Tax=Sparassis crispa TaxID=139825 RepID=A0A401GZ36_9APHY|nr:hypothetical protein SCP_1101010 [Sparassis crispa]GBE87425.1 hypothetical protein SCP_1101010 [Sparassis crispa]